MERALRRLGYVKVRQRGSHMAYRHPQTRRTVIVPKHDAVKPGTLRAILRTLGITYDEFLKLL